MNSKEIAELAAWTAKSIQDTVAQGGRKLDDAGADIIREYVQTGLLNWQRGEKITVESSAQLAKEIMLRRRHETKNENAVYNALYILGSKFPLFVAEQQRERDVEAARLAASMPAVKV